MAWRSWGTSRPWLSPAIIARHESAAQARTANREPEAGPGAVGVTKRPRLGALKDTMTMSRQGWTAGACQAAWQRQPGLQDDGLQPRQLQQVQGTLRQRRRVGVAGDQRQEASAEKTACRRRARM